MFKLFLCDIGLLGSMLDLSPGTLINQDFGITKGFFVENYVACEWKASGAKSLYSWSERNSEIEFLLSLDDEVVPVEVKSGLRTRSQSLCQFRKKYNPHSSIIISGKPCFSSKGNPINIPLYYAGFVPDGL